MGRGGGIAIKGDSPINKSTLISTLRDMFIFKGASDATRRNSGHFIRYSLVDLHQLILTQILKELISTNSSLLPFSSKCGCCGSPFCPKFLVQLLFSIHIIKHCHALPTKKTEKKIYTKGKIEAQHGHMMEKYVFVGSKHEMF